MPVRRAVGYRGWDIFWDGLHYEAYRYNRVVKAYSRVEIERQIDTIENEHLRWLRGEEDICPFER